ncbi:MAG: DUF192 domain-containing protein [Bryobacteraceae bacterium]|nr:DUF192 domain-containing protein [Bryobacteraceae bacterium]
MQPLRLAFFLTLIFLSSCSEPTTRPEDIGTRLITMPAGQRVRVEVKILPEDIMRGMMFRDRLDPDRGMMFLHKPPGKYPYWMYQVKIPLDIIWMDQQGNIVEISANTPPCPSATASQCPYFGGTRTAQVVLELASGMAAKYGLATGMRVSL